jgi:ubiquinol-cytochrome c reductase cytochrome c1 subunit
MLLRWILGFIGAVFAGILLISLISGVATYIHNPPARKDEEEHRHAPKPNHHSNDGP